MFFIILRPILIICGVIGIVYIIYLKSKRTLDQTIRRQKLNEALDAIEDVLKIGEILPEINVKNLKTAKDKIASILKEGEKIK